MASLEMEIEAGGAEGGGWEGSGGGKAGGGGGCIEEVDELWSETLMEEEDIST